VPDVEGAPLPFGLVGHGWRADFFHRVAAALPDRLRCTGVVTRGEAAGADVERRWGVPTHRTVDAMLAAGAPLAVVTSVPWAATPVVVRDLVARGAAVLAETPPAPDTEGLRGLWADVGTSGLVQVAEQNPFLPALVALGRLVDDGVLGTPTSARLSWTHGYHAVAVLRRLLGAGGDPVTVRASAVEGPLVQGPGRAGRPEAPAEVAATHTVATLQFSPSISPPISPPIGTTVAPAIGTYDFTAGQWYHPLRRRHVLVQGSRGEVIGTSVVWAGEDGRPLDASLVRRQTGLDGDLEGADLDTITWCGRTLYANPYRGSRLSDEEIAVAALVERTLRWRRGEADPPYPLAEGCQDQLLSLAIGEAAATGLPVTTRREPWAAALGRG
jgi:predicted dehydrogenase